MQKRLKPLRVKQGRINYTCSKGKDRFIDYIVKPFMVWFVFTAGIYLDRHLHKRPLTVKTQLLIQASSNVAKKHKDSGLTAWFMTRLFYCTSRMFEFDNAYFVRYHDTLKEYNRLLKKNGLVKQ